MKVLVLNCGSSSIKYKLYNMDDESVLAQGGVERIGLDNAFIKVKLILPIILLARLRRNVMSRLLPT